MSEPDRARARKPVTTQMTATDAGAPEHRWVPRVRAIVAEHQHRRGPLLPVLHAVQAEFGYLPAEAVRVVADALNLTRADVHGVVTFYRDFRRSAPGRTVVRICRAEACQAVGARALVSEAEDVLGIPLGGTTADGAVTLGEVFCLGNCALGPSVQVGDRLVGRVDRARLRALLDDVAPGATG